MLLNQMLFVCSGGMIQTEGVIKNTQGTKLYSTSNGRFNSYFNTKNGDIVYNNKFTSNNSLAYPADYLGIVIGSDNTPPPER